MWNEFIFHVGLIYRNGTNALYAELAKMLKNISFYFFFGQKQWETKSSSLPLSSYNPECSVAYNECFTLNALQLLLFSSYSKECSEALRSWLILGA